MKFGINTSILGHYNFEEMVAFASQVGYECVEVACWPLGKAERRYAGVSHIDVNNFDKKEIDRILKKYNMEISALAYYPNALDHDKTTQKNSVDHLLKVIDAADELDVSMVTTFIGRDHTKSVNENLKEMMTVWPEIIRHAENKKIKIAIENCPMWFSDDEWPGGKNLFTTPKIWKQVFELLPSDYLGINYDPSHFVWQQIDYIKPLHEFKDKIFHVHFKDIKLYQDKLDQVGVMANPLEYMAPKLPGLGDVNWAQYVSALNDINYKGYACVEVEDKSYEDTHEALDKSVQLSYRYLRQYVI